MRRAPPQVRHTRYVCLLADKPRIVLFALRMCMLHLHVPALPHGLALDPTTAYTCIPCKHAAFGQRVTHPARFVCTHANWTRKRAHHGRAVRDMATCVYTCATTQAEITSDSQGHLAFGAATPIAAATAGRASVRNSASRRCSQRCRRDVRWQSA